MIEPALLRRQRARLAVQAQRQAQRRTDDRSPAQVTADNAKVAAWLARYRAALAVPGALPV